MSDSVEDDVGRALNAVRTTNNHLKELRSSRHSAIPSSLVKADAALDKLCRDLNLLTESPEALSVFQRSTLIEASTSTTTSFSQALIDDMGVIATRFASMRSLDSDEILDLNDQAYENIAELADHYDETIFSVLTEHNMCV
jgi:hypothetical protein